ncbi:MAG: hypothetical protein IJ467_07940 [Bacteroidaceae bacterium]|nr:hypothetical protein [Bacteroidaceae bacterium]
MWQEWVVYLVVLVCIGVVIRKGWHIYLAFKGRKDPCSDCSLAGQCLSSGREKAGKRPSSSSSACSHRIKRCPCGEKNG